MKDNQNYIEQIIQAVLKKRKEIIDEFPNDEKKLSSADTIVKMVTTKNFMKYISREDSFYLFKYCDFPEDKWNEIYDLALFQTINNDTYTYINPEDIENLASQS